MGKYDPNLLPFYSLPYYTNTYIGIYNTNLGQRFKNYREKSLKGVSYAIL